jgi:hypothetical protein
MAPRPRPSAMRALELCPQGGRRREGGGEASCALQAARGHALFCAWCAFGSRDAKARGVTSSPLLPPRPPRLPPPAPPAPPADGRGPPCGRSKSTPARQTDRLSSGRLCPAPAEARRTRSPPPPPLNQSPSFPPPRPSSCCTERRRCTEPGPKLPAAGDGQPPGDGASITRGRQIWGPGVPRAHLLSTCAEEARAPSPAGSPGKRATRPPGRVPHPQARTARVKMGGLRTPPLPQPGASPATRAAQERLRRPSAGGRLSAGGRAELPG